MSAGEWIALATLVFGAMAGLAAIVRGLIGARMADTEQKVKDAGDRLRDLELDLARNYVRRETMREEIEGALEPLTKRIDFQGRVLVEIAKRMHVPAVELQEMG